MSYQYPTTVRWWQLSPAQQSERLDVAEDLAALFLNALGDPRLSAWQEGFAGSMLRKVRQHKGKARISLKEWAKIRELGETLATEMPRVITEIEDDGAPLDGTDPDRERSW